MSCKLQINKQAVAKSFSKAASHYDQFAQLQRDIGNELLKQSNIESAKTLLDLGCGTGHFTELLHQLYSTAQIDALDLSPSMLQQVKSKKLERVNLILADIDYLPDTLGPYHHIFSNLVVQWSADLQYCLQQLVDKLHDNGQLSISTLTHGTLTELQQAWLEVDSKPHTNTFLSLSQIEKSLQSIDCSSYTIKQQTITLLYPNVIEVMRALKGIGANHVHGKHQAKLSGKKVLSKLAQGYGQFVTQHNQLPLTYQVCYIQVYK